MNSNEIANYMGQYAKKYHAGAFATPTAKDLKSGTPQTYEFDGGVFAYKVLTRDSNLKDWTGRRYTLPKGSAVISHIAAEPDATIPDLSNFQFVYSYIEDQNITNQLRQQGRGIVATRISAASEIIRCWGIGGDSSDEPDIDLVTVASMQLGDDLLSPDDISNIIAEVESLEGWFDDYPFYSDGSWDALSLRGFNPADPTWGVKPAEMGARWNAAHPEAAQYTSCDWTQLIQQMPWTYEFIERLTADWHTNLERVRLLRMQGRGGKGGHLGRHTDIGDKAAGVLDGQIMRFHIPLITDPDITMSIWTLAGEKEEIFLEPWTMWYLDARKPHAVDNNAGIDRVHLVIDAEANEYLRYKVLEGDIWA